MRENQASLGSRVRVQLENSRPVTNVQDAVKGALGGLGDEIREAHVIRDAKIFQGKEGKGG